MSLSRVRPEHRALFLQDFGGTSVRADQVDLFAGDFDAPAAVPAATAAGAGAAPPADTDADTRLAALHETLDAVAAASRERGALAFARALPDLHDLILREYVHSSEEPGAWIGPHQGGGGGGAGGAEVRAPLLPKRRQTLSHVLRVSQAVGEQLLQAQALSERALHAPRDGLLIACTASGPFLQICSAISRAVGINCSGSTTALINLTLSAVCVSIALPLSSNSMARAPLISRGSRWVTPHPGISPKPTSGCPNLAPAAAIRRSQARAHSNPPPRARPLTAAISGLGMS